MKKQLKIPAILALFVMVLFIVACGASSDATDENSDAKKDSINSENTTEVISKDKVVKFDTSFVMKNKFVYHSTEAKYELIFTTGEVYNLSYSEQTGEGDYGIIGTYEIIDNVLSLRPYKCFRKDEEVGFSDFEIGFAYFTLVNSEYKIPWDGFGQFTTYTKYLKSTTEAKANQIGVFGIEAYEKK